MDLVTVLDESVRLNDAYPAWFGVFRLMYRIMGAGFVAVQMVFIIHLWATIHFMTYANRVLYFQRVMLSISLVLTMIEAIQLSSRCRDSCLLLPFGWVNFIIRTCLVFIGSALVLHIVVTVLRQRNNAIALLRKSSISLSLFYRLLIGLFAVLGLSLFTFLNYLKGTGSGSGEYEAFLPSNRLESIWSNAILGFLVAIVLGGSDESLNTFRKWLGLPPKVAAHEMSTQVSLPTQYSKQEL